MPNRIEPLIHHLRKMLRPVDDVRVTDGQLLGQFVATRDERAFEALLRRHGRMVFSVCRRVLGDVPEVEDAFQATFLVLTRKAAAVVPRDAIGNWLYGVAYRTALKARAMKVQRQAREQHLEDMAQPDVQSEEDWRRLVAYLDQELSRLPDKYRAAIVLCELEGLSRKEAARQLKVPEGTLSSRLATARKLLAKRLARYGPISVATLGAVLSDAASAAIPPSLASSTVKVSAGVSSWPFSLLLKEF